MQSSTSISPAASPDEAIQRLLARIGPVEHEFLPLERAVGRFVADATKLLTDRDSPPADVSAMDGYALRHADLSLRTVPIAGEVRIGLAPPTLPAGACLRIVTGGPVPHGADAVVKREEVTEAPDRITIDEAVAKRIRSGENIRRRGENGAAGTAILPSGALLTAAGIGALAAAGIMTMTVARPLRVAILTTGDELVSHRPDEVDEGGNLQAPRPLTPWQLRDSNGPALAALLASAAWIGRVDRSHVADEEAALDAAIQSALSSADALLLTGGVSMGHRDFVPQCLARAGVDTLFHTVPQRPGKPVLGGVSRRGQPVLGLPGNPVSVLVTARRMAWPVLARLAGCPQSASTSTADGLVLLRNADERTLHLWWQRLVRNADDGAVDLVDGRGSGDVIAAARSDGFVELPPHACGPGPWPYYRWAPSAAAFRS